MSTYVLITKGHEAMKPLIDLLGRLDKQFGVKHIAVVDSTGGAITCEEDHKKYCEIVVKEK